MLQEREYCAEQWHFSSSASPVHRLVLPGSEIIIICKAVKDLYRESVVGFIPLPPFCQFSVTIPNVREVPVSLIKYRNRCS